MTGRRFLLCVLVVVAVIAGTAIHQPGGTPTASAQETLSVPVGDMDVAFRVLGYGEPLVLIMGYAGTMDIWDQNFVQALASHFLVILFDNRGMGATTAGTAPFSIAQFADDTAGLIAALGMERAHVLGYSMGASIAQELVLRHPERVEGLVLLSGSCGGPEAAPPDPAAMQAFQDALANREGTLAEKRLRVSASLVPPDWLATHLAYMLNVVSQPIEPVSGANVALQGQAQAAWPGACDRLGQVTTPTLIVSGMDDVLTPPANGQIIAGRIPGSWLVRIAGGGHGLMYQFPGRLAHILHDFLEP